jgi:ribosomal protein L29
MANNRLAKSEREELSGLDAAALNEKLEEAKKKLWTDQFALGKRSLTNTAELSKTRKRIARIQTYLGQLEAAQEVGK